MRRPDPSEYAGFYRPYVDRVPGIDILVALELQRTEVLRLAASVSPERERFAYAPGKWSVRQLLGHLGDGERAFGFRAFCFSRGETAALPAFDEDLYVERAPYPETPLAALADEFALLRAGNLAFLRRLEEPEWSRSGVVDGRTITVRALAYVMAGHVRHHLDSLRERYGVAE